MELTPIKVRGKRGGKGKSVADLPTKDSKSKDRDKRKSREKRRKSRRSQPSTIERSIPLEVLERIFWLSENVNLPRASPLLGRLLSGTSTLRETFLCAFGPTWEVWFGCVHSKSRSTTRPVVHSYADWEDDAARFGGNPEFQSALLECSWATIDTILDCWDIWVQRHAKDLPFEHIPLWRTPDLSDFHTSTSNTVGFSHIKEARYYFYHDYNAFRLFEQETCPEAVLSFDREADSTFIEVHRDTRIPDELLTGPWDEGAVQKLFWLLRAGARISPDQTWEITREGFRNAIPDQDAPNVAVIRLLDNLGVFAMWPQHVKDEENTRIRSIHAHVTAGTHKSLGPSLHTKYTYAVSRLQHDGFVQMRLYTQQMISLMRGGVPRRPLPSRLWCSND